MVEHLKIGDKEYPVRISYYVMKKIKEKTGMSLGQALKKSDEGLELHEDILWYALQMGAYAENKSMELDLEREEMPLVLDMVFVEYMKLFTSDSFFPKGITENAEQRLGELEEEIQKKTKQNSQAKEAPQRTT